MSSEERAAAVATESSTMLEEAWRRFAVYDHNANLQQRGFLRMRIWIAVLGVVATLVAVLYAIVSEETHELTDWRFYLRLLVLATPITASVLVAMAARIDRAMAWVMVRGSAEALKREIYRYRARVGPYHPERAEARDRDRHLAAKIESINRRLASSEAVLEGLKPYTAGRLPPLYAAAADDDGFSELTAERYIELRLRDQLDYYRRRSGRLVKQYKRLQWAVVGLGGVGTLFAAVGLEIWVPVAISLAGALGTYLQLRNVESTLTAYNRSAMELENVLTWWQAVPTEEKADPALREQLVGKTEAVLQTENVDWQLEMQEAMEELKSEESVRKVILRAVETKLDAVMESEEAVAKGEKAEAEVELVEQSEHRGKEESEESISE